MINGAGATQKMEAELIASTALRGRLDVEIKALEYATMREEMKAGKHDLARLRDFPMANLQRF